MALKKKMLGRLDRQKLDRTRRLAPRGPPLAIAQPQQQVAQQPAAQLICVQPAILKICISQTNRAISLKVSLKCLWFSGKCR